MSKQQIQLIHTHLYSTVIIETESVPCSRGWTKQKENGINVRLYKKKNTNDYFIRYFRWHPEFSYTLAKGGKKNDCLPCCLQSSIFHGRSTGWGRNESGNMRSVPFSSSLMNAYDFLLRTSVNNHVSFRKTLSHIESKKKSRFDRLRCSKRRLTTRR